MFKNFFNNKDKKIDTSVVEEVVKKDYTKLECKGSYRLEVVEVNTKEENEQHYKDYMEKYNDSPNMIHYYEEPYRFASKLLYDVILYTNDDDLYSSGESHLLSIKGEINIFDTLGEKEAYESIIAIMEEEGRIVRELKNSISKKFKKHLEEGKINALKESMKNEEFEIKLTISVEKD